MLNWLSVASAFRTAITTSPHPDPNTANNNASADIVVSAPSTNLSLEKVADLTNDVNGDTLVGPGDQITYGLSLGNSGGLDATTIVVTDVLPAGVTYSSDTPSVGTYDSATGQWTVPALLVGPPATLDVVVTVDAGTEGQTITNTATITSATPPNDPDTSNNSATANFTVAGVTVVPPLPPPNLQVFVILSRLWHCPAVKLTRWPQSNCHDALMAVTMLSNMYVNFGSLHHKANRIPPLLCIQGGC